MSTHIWRTARSLPMECWALLGTVRLYARCILSSLFRAPEYRYAMQDSEFLIRKNGSDMLTLQEVWNQHVYLVPPPDGIVVDIGANIGAFTVLAAKTARHVFAFEPLEENIRILQRNTQTLRNVSIFPYAIAGAEGTRSLAFGHYKPGKASIVMERGTERQHIHAKTLPQIFDLCRIDRIDLLKMDIEGAEYEIFFSVPKEILHRIGAITMEFHDFLPHQHYSTFVRLFREAGFTVATKPSHYWLTHAGYLHAVRP